MQRDANERLRAILLERTRRLIALDAVLRRCGQPGVLGQPEEDLPLLEAALLGTPEPPLDAGAPEDGGGPGDAQRRSSLRPQFRVLRGGRDAS